MLKLSFFLSLAGAIFALGTGTVIAINYARAYTHDVPLHTDPFMLWIVFRLALLCLSLGITLFVLVHKKGDRHPF